MTTALTRDELAAVLGRVGRGDRDAFETVYQATSAKLMGVTLRILGDRALAEDVLQDTYVTVWKRADSFDPGRASPITWLVTIARNRAIDRLRSAPMRVRTTPVEDAAGLADDTQAADARIEAADEARRLALCLDELEEKARGAIRTAFFDGVTYEALAEQASVPLGTMKSWIRRGLRKLRGCLER